VTTPPTADILARVAEIERSLAERVDYEPDKDGSIDRRHPIYRKQGEEIAKLLIA
jgi:hypothetical protein